MGAAKFKNFWVYSIEDSVSSGDTIVRVSVAAATLLGTLTGGDYYNLTLWDGQQDPEIVQVTANPLTGYLTVTRAQESTTAKAWAAGTQIMSALTEEVINLALAAYADSEVLLAQNYLKLSGGTMTGNIVLPGDPTASNHAARKAYVDNVLGGLLPVSGGSMSGTINMQSNRIIQLPAALSSSEPVRKTEFDARQTQVENIFSDVEGSLVTGGTASAYTATSLRTITTLSDGLTIELKMHAANEAGATLDLNGIGAKAIQIVSGEAVGLGILLADISYRFTYSSALDCWLVHHVFDLGLYFPPGIVVDYGGLVAPTGWDLCYGQEYLKTAEPRLYSIIGDTFGSSDADHFNAPDCRDRARVGKGNMGGVAAARLDSMNTLGATSGSKDFQVAASNLPTLNVIIPAGQGSHYHTGDDAGVYGSAVVIGSGGGSAFGGNTSTNTNSATLPQMSGSVNGTGANTAISRVQPSIAFNTIIKK